MLQRIKSIVYGGFRLLWRGFKFAFNISGIALLSCLNADFLVDKLKTWYQSTHQSPGFFQAITSGSNPYFNTLNAIDNSPPYLHYLMRGLAVLWGAYYCCTTAFAVVSWSWGKIRGRTPSQPQSQSQSEPVQPAEPITVATTLEKPKVEPTDESTESKDAKTPPRHSSEKKKEASTQRGHLPTFRLMRSRHGRRPRLLVNKTRSTHISGSNQYATTRPT